MTIKAEVSTRKIVFNNNELPDINPALSVQEVVQSHAASNPALTNFTVEGPSLQDGTRVYTVKTRVGNKG